MAVVADGAGPPGLKDPKARLFKIGAYGGATVGDAGCNRTDQLNEIK